MALNYSCYDVPCPQGQTCKGGSCVDEAMNPADAAKLPDYVTGMGEGDDGGCFSVGVCAAGLLPAIPVDETKCQFALPETSGAPTAAVDPYRTACKATGMHGFGDGRSSVSVSATDPKTVSRGSSPAGRAAVDGLLNVQVSYDGGYTEADPRPRSRTKATNHLQIRRSRRTFSSHRASATCFTAARRRPTSSRASSRAAICALKVVTQSICHKDQLALMGADDEGNAPPDGRGSSLSTATDPPRAALAIVRSMRHENNAPIFDANDDQELPARR